MDIKWGRTLEEAKKETQKENTNKRLMDFESFFERKKKARTHTKKNKVISEQVTVYGSMLKADLKQDRGTRTPIIVEKTFGANELKNAIYEKISRYHKHVADFEKSDYKLVYKSGDTIRCIPGTQTPFTIEGYKKDLGVGYQNLNFYLMLYEVFSSSEDEVKPSWRR